MSPRSPEERYQEWLERMEIPIENQTNIEALKEYLAGQLIEPSDAQVQALWSATGIKDTLADFGIHAVIVHFTTGNQLRYGIQGLAGLWGWEAVQTIMAEEA
jgi:hypothetical protein